MNPPPQHVEEAWQAAEFYVNKILMEFRSKDPNQVAWVGALKELYQALKVSRNLSNTLRTLATPWRRLTASEGSVQCLATLPQHSTHHVMRCVCTNQEIRSNDA